MKSTVTIITHHGVPVAAITNFDEACQEFRYLAFHGDGYEQHTIRLETRCGDYARLEEIQSQP